jgi:hypothetical protein
VSDASPGSPASGSRRRWYQRASTLLPGRPVEPATLYIAAGAAMGFASGLLTTVYGLYAVRDVGLSPLQLVLAGTALELTVFLLEVPTGVVADLVSRRLSQIVGYVLVGLAAAVLALMPSFAGFLISSAVWGAGWTFISGAAEAWLADEAGEARAAAVYPQAQQWYVGAVVAGIPVAGMLGLIDLRLALAAISLTALGLAVALCFAMTERAFVADRGDTGCGAVGRPVAHALATARDALGMMRRRPVLVAMLAIAVLAGASSEAFDRLWPLHLLESFAVPGSVDEVVWFAALALVAHAGGLLWLRYASARTDTAQSTALVRTMILATLVVIAGIAAFALAPVFWVALVAFWAVQWGRIVTEPFFIAWVNRGLDPRVRATVISMVGQGDSFGQIAGGPVLGVIAALRGVRAALVVSSLVLAPALAFYWRHRHGEAVVGEEQVAEE